MKKNIAIVAGGDSGEYEVSINSGNVVARNLDPNRFNVYLIIMQGSNWYFEDGEKSISVDKNDFSIISGDRKIQFDCVFIAIHGTPGEDGKLQGYFEMLKIPFTTCNSIVSGITFDKDLTKEIVKQWGISVPESVLLKKDSNPEISKIIEKLGLPCFVKPNKGGSSVGMTRVISVHDLAPAIKRAFNEDDEVIIEQFIEGREVTCGVLRKNGSVMVLPVTEIISKKEYFDYDAKYKGMADEITPAEIEIKDELQCKSISAFLYRNFKCRGVVRFDFIYNDTGMYFLELNTVPGLSDASIVPQQAEAMGISLKELFTILIEEECD